MAPAAPVTVTILEMARTYPPGAVPWPQAQASEASVALKVALGRIAAVARSGSGR